jgi:hypothetical protein
VSVGRKRMGRGRPDVLTYCQCTSKSTSQHGVPNETAMLARVPMFQSNFLPRLSLTVPASKRVHGGQGLALDLTSAAMS